MPLTIPCPKCMRELNVPEEAAGKMVRCPACGETFALAQPTSAPTPPAPVSAQPLPTTPDDSRRREEDEEERRPRRRRDFDDDDDRYDDIDSRRSYARPHRAGAVLTLGILALCLVCLPLLSWILGGIAISMANNDLMQMARGHMDRSGQGTTQTGKTLATVGVVLTTIWFFIACLMRFSSLR